MRIIHFVGTMLFGAFAMTTADSQDSPLSAEIYSLPYVRLYTDAQGVSHFKEETFTIRPNASRPTPSTLALENTKGAIVLRLKSGAVEDFHKAPRRQYLFMLRGLVEVTASDGEKRKFSPGDVMLMEDTTGKGHITKSIGKEDHVVLFVPVE